MQNIDIYPKLFDIDSSFGVQGINLEILFSKNSHAAYYC